eukprot:gene16822-biopygen7623
MSAGNQRYEDYAISATSNEGGLVNLGTFTLTAGDLLEGTNVLSVEVHQNSASSSDTGLDVQLSGIAPAGGDDGGNIVPLTGDFLVAPIADTSNIVISEIMYNPLGTSEDGEWIELMNISAATADLSNLTFAGIDYAFPLGFTLAPDARVVVVKDQTEFASLYNTAGINIAPGDFSTSSLSNSGEQIALIDALGLDARRFKYNDKDPWPTSPDGDGYSIGDANTFTGDPIADNDGDGLTALLEYALGSIQGDTRFSPESIPSSGTDLFDDGIGNFKKYLTLTYRRNLAADDILIKFEVSSDLISWDPLRTTAVSAISNDDGTETVIRRSLIPIEDQERNFIRLR